jgi:hypothetical protein
MLQLLQKSRSHSDANQPLHIFGARVFSIWRYKREMEALSLVAHAPENLPHGLSQKNDFERKIHLEDDDLGQHRATV